MPDVFRTYTDSVTRLYARLANAVKATDDTMSPINETFRSIHARLTRGFGLDVDATPDRVITSVYAHYRAHGGEATVRNLAGSPEIADEMITHLTAR